MKYITIDRRNFLAGASSSDDSADGGFSPSSYNLNPSKSPGVMYGTASATTITTAPTGSIISRVQDPNILGTDAILISNDNKIYTLNGSLVLDATLASKNFSQAMSNIVAFNGYFIAPTAKDDTDLVRIDISGGTASINTVTWWTTTLAQAALSTSTADRPLFGFEKHLYIGDKNKLHRVSDALVVSNGIVTLDTFSNITALGIDPSTGKMLVAVQIQGFNASATNAADSYIALYDGLSNKFDRIVPTQGKVTAFFSVAGTVYVAYQNNIGVWTGVGVRFLRKLNRASLASAEIIRKDKFASSGHTLLFVDKDEVIAFGEVIRGQSSFRTIYRAGSTISAIFMKNSTTLAVAEAGSLKTIDLTSFGIDAFLQSNKYFFEEPVDIKKIEVLYNEQVSAGLQTASATIYGDDDSGKFVAVKNTTSVAKKLIVGQYRGEPTNSVYFTLNQTNGGYGWRRIRIGYQQAGDK